MAQVPVVVDIAPSSSEVPATKPKFGAKRKLPQKFDAPKADLGPKLHVPTGTMTTVLRHVTTQVSLRGFRRLLEDCPVALCALRTENDRRKLVSLHALLCLYNLETKLEIENAKIWGQSSMVNFRSYRPIDKVVAGAIEAFSNWMNPKGYYVYVDMASAMAQLERIRDKYWEEAFPGRSVVMDYGVFAANDLSRIEHEIKRGLGNDAMRVPVDSSDFSLLHVGVLKVGRDSYSACGSAALTHQSELYCRVLMLREYKREGLAVAYAPRDESDFDSVHFTAGFSVGRAWSRAEAMFQLKSAVSVSLNRIA